jgi:hypothetical protein
MIVISKLMRGKLRPSSRKYATTLHDCIISKTVNHREKDRADSEKQLDKLYRDITTGNLRRKRGADFELSDSDDDAAERRRRKQLEFARMRKALMADEKIGKIGNTPLSPKLIGRH